MKRQMYDVIVVGLGAAGSAAAYHLAKKNVRVLGLDRYAPPHIHGSTHSESRIIRRAYFEGARYGPMLNRAYELWASLEQESNQRLIHFCGCLNIGPRQSGLVTKAQSTAAGLGLDLEILTPGEVNQRFPGYDPPEECVAVYEDGAGFIQPELCVEAHLKLARSHGAHLHYGEPASSWRSDSKSVSVTTSRGTYTADAMINATGAWMSEFSRVPVKIERVTNTWFAPVAPLFSPSQCPVFIYEDLHGGHSYGCPDVGFGVKVGLHHVGPVHAHPDEVSRITTAQDETGPRRVVEELMPQAACQSLNTRVCLYTNTPDKHYLIDYEEGNHERVIVGSACSGHGFKMSSAVGEALAALALDQQPPVDVSPFCWRWPATDEELPQ